MNRLQEGSIHHRLQTAATTFSSSCRRRTTTTTATGMVTTTAATPSLLLSLSLRSFHSQSSFSSPTITTSTAAAALCSTRSLLSSARRGGGASDGHGDGRHPPPKDADNIRESAPFNNIYTKPFPVRAAIEIGSGGLATIAVGRVDARQGALKELLYQHQLPVDLSVEEEEQQPEVTSANITNTTLPSTTLAPKYRHLSATVIRDIFDKVSQLLLSLQNLHNAVSTAGITEYSGLLTWPFYDCPKDQMQDLAMSLTKEFKVDFRVLGMHELGSDVTPGRKRMKEVLERARRSSTTTTGGTDADGTHQSSKTTNTTASSLPPSEIVETLTFLGYATTAKVQDWDRLLVLVEEPQVVLEDGSTSASTIGAEGNSTDNMMYTGGAIHVIGTVEDAEETQGEQLDNELVSQAITGTGGATSSLSEKLSKLRMRRYTIPFETPDVQQMLLQNIQRRDPVNLHPHSSPNPVLRAEAGLLRKALHESLEEDLPEWVMEKLANGALVVGASENSGLLNTAARIAGRVNVGTERLEQATDYGICGLTDVLIGHTYKNPCLVVPQAILCSAIMRSFRVSSIEYIPQVSIAQALLVHPSFWTYNRREAITDKLKQERWYKNVGERTYVTPHQARSPTNPNLAPQYNNSLKDGLGAPYYTTY